MPKKHNLQVRMEKRVGIYQNSPTYQLADEALQKALILLGLPVENPLQELVRPGDCVLLKPNLIRESHLYKENEWEQIVTHGTIIRSVVGLVVQALHGKGRIIIADGPQTDSDFPLICQRTGLKQFLNEFRSPGVSLELMDLRQEHWLQKEEIISQRICLPGDPLGYTQVDLKGASEFTTYQLNGHFYGADYNIAETASFHRNGYHNYILCRTAMEADVIINLPKLKTHKKTGITLSLKNVVGVNGHRNCLPHHTIGTPDEMGDEFPTSQSLNKIQSRFNQAFRRSLWRHGGLGGVWARKIKRLGKKIFGGSDQVVREGNWYGNDTAWRMVLDLNKVLFYYAGDGTLRKEPRRYLSIVDGIIAGEGDGPVAAEPKPAGLLVAGFNPVAVDTACAVLMGFDYRKIPLLACAWKISNHPLADFHPSEIHFLSNMPYWNGKLEDLERAPHLGFLPHFGWRGHIERE